MTRRIASCRVTVIGPIPALAPVGHGRRVQGPGRPSAGARRTEGRGPATSPSAATAIESPSKTSSSLAAHLVAVDDRRVRLGRAAAHERQTQVVLGALSSRERRWGRRRGRPRPARRPRTDRGGDPEVFADRQGDVDAVQPHHRQLGPGHEVARLVEDAVVRQVPLVVADDDLAAVEQGGGIARSTVAGVGVSRAVVAGGGGARVDFHRRGSAALGVRQVPDDDGGAAQTLLAASVGPRGRRGRARWRGRRTPGARGPRPDNRSASSRGRRRDAHPGTAAFGRPLGHQFGDCPRRSPTRVSTWARATRSCTLTPPV